MGGQCACGNNIECLIFIWMIWSFIGTIDDPSLLKLRYQGYLVPWDNFDDMPAWNSCPFLESTTAFYIIFFLFIHLKYRSIIRTRVNFFYNHFIFICILDIAFNWLRILHIKYTKYLFTSFLGYFFNKVRIWFV